jgi:hypothetical protein
MFAEGLVSHSSFYYCGRTAYSRSKSAQMQQLSSRTSSKVYIIWRFENLLCDHVFQPSEATPDTPTDVLPKYGCILVK